MNDQDITIEDLENTIAANKFMIAQNAALQKLLKNRDFKTIVMEGYFKTYAIEQVQARTNPGLQSEASQTKILRAIDGISELHSFLEFIQTAGNQAANDILLAEQEIDLMRQEEAGAVA